MANQEVYAGHGKDKASGRDVNLFRDESPEGGGKLLVRDAKTAAVLASGAGGLADLTGYALKLVKEPKPEPAA